MARATHNAPDRITEQRIMSPPVDSAALRRSSRAGSFIVGAFTVLICGVLFVTADNLQFRYPNSGTVWETIKALALALVPAVIVAVYANDRTVEDTSARVAQIVGSDVVGTITREINDLIPGRDTYGLVRFLPRMPYAELFGLLEAGDELLWHDTYWPNNAEFRELIRSALMRGAKMRMLVIDPESDNAGYRADEFKSTDQAISRTFREEALQFAQSITGIFSAMAATLPSMNGTELRLYRDLPCIPMYIVRRNGQLYRGYSSFFLTKPTGFNFVHLEWTPTVVSNGTHGLLEEMAAYFEQKWAQQAMPPRGGGILFPPQPAASTS